ncbi:erythromycin esterase family protein [Paenibacillus sp. 481]|nr:erythromycin esterase family protein [Paenibacillus sp. 481]
MVLASTMALSMLLSFGATAYGQAGITVTNTAEQAQQTAATNVPKQARTSTETRQQWNEWTRKNAHALDSIKPETVTDGGKMDANRFKDLEMLKPLLKDKRIVYLGESSHGAAEFNSAKTRLIQFLHQEMGFNVVAFETSLGKAASAYGNAKSAPSVKTMKDSIFSIWWSQETLPLFDYIKETQKSNTPLQLAGFDMQPTGTIFNSAWIGNDKLEKSFNDAELELEEWNYSSDLEGYRKAKPRLTALYKQIKQMVPERAEALRKQYPDNPHIVKLTERALDNRLQVVNGYLELGAQTNAVYEGKSYDFMSIVKSTEYRDRMMADNLVWLATHVYPNEKIIVWAHNGHISKAFSKERAARMPMRYMGELMQQTKFKDLGYVIGLFMGGGKNADTAKELIDVLPPMPHSIEEVMKGAGHPYSFIDLKSQTLVPENTWINQPMFSYVDGTMPVISVPKEQYDGILYIDHTNAPTYIK